MYLIEVFEIIDGQEVKINLNGQTVNVVIALPSVMDESKDVYVYFGAEDSASMTLVEDAYFDKDAKVITFTTDQLGNYDLVRFTDGQKPNQPNTPSDDVDQPIITKPTVEVPNTGVVAKTSTGSAASVSATSGIIVNALALAGAAVAMVVRFIRRRQA